VLLLLLLLLLLLVTLRVVSAVNDEQHCAATAKTTASLLYTAPYSIEVCLGLNVQNVQF
jgi:hypothetical protein